MQASVEPFPPAREYTGEAMVISGGGTIYTMSSAHPLGAIDDDVGTDCDDRGRRAGADPADRRQGSTRLRDAVSAVRPAPSPLPVPADSKRRAHRGSPGRCDAGDLAERRALQRDVPGLDVDLRHRVPQGAQGASAPGEPSGGGAALGS